MLDDQALLGVVHSATGRRWVGPDLDVARRALALAQAADLPEIVALDQPIMPPLDVFARVLGDVAITPVPVPHDCTDGFLGAYWRRPEVYLDPKARAAISTFAKIKDASAGLARLKADLASGAWTARYGDLLKREALDIGYRLVTAERAAPS